MDGAVLLTSFEAEEAAEDARAAAVKEAAAAARAPLAAKPDHRHHRATPPAGTVAHLEVSVLSASGLRAVKGKRPSACALFTRGAPDPSRNRPFAASRPVERARDPDFDEVRVRSARGGGSSVSFVCVAATVPGSSDRGGTRFESRCGATRCPVETSMERFVCHRD